MDPKFITVIGASAGGISALTQILRQLPGDVPAAFFVTLHVPEGGSILPAILERASGLPAAHPADKQPIAAGRIFVAPPGFHMRIEKGRVRIQNGPRENQYRPAINPLFRSAARTYGPKV